LVLLIFRQGKASEIPNYKTQNTMTQIPNLFPPFLKGERGIFGDSNLDMPFDSFDLEALARLAQRGELVEPFVICYSPARRLSGEVLGVFSIREATVPSLHYFF
jgi:hypothetical protein